MRHLEAIMFDLDDTLLDRGKAADAMFYVIADKCYSGAATAGMMTCFMKHDNNGYANKIDVLNNLFNEFPPDYRIPPDEIYYFWNANFPDCFSVDPERFSVAEKIAAAVKTAIITNGKSSQMAKIKKTGLDKIFSTIIISEEAGVWKPDPQIFALALKKLGVRAEEALYVGDNLFNDIGGCQRAGINGVWFNPRGLKNETDVVPFAEIGSFSQLLDLGN